MIRDLVWNGLQRLVALHFSSDGYGTVECSINGVRRTILRADNPCSKRLKYAIFVLLKNHADGQELGAARAGVGVNDQFSNGVPHG